jgi:uroporphyrinogen-III synthase
MNTSAQPLAGHGIVITRPEAQAGALAEELGKLGADIILFPTIAILPASDAAPLARALAQLDVYHYAVFVSANAVAHVLPRVAQWPASVRALAPGPGTAAALRAGGVPDPIVPASTYDSEGLLALPQLADVAGKRVVIFRGGGGRELLGDTLESRGAQVEYVSVYRREKPQQDLQLLMTAWQAGRVGALVVTSSEGLENLWDMLGPGGRAALSDTELFVPHPRIAGRARKLGLSRITLTEGGDAGLRAGLLHYFSKQAQHT